MKIMKSTVTVLASLGIASVAFGAAEIGKPAPDFTAADITGKTHKLTDYKGKIVVLEAYNFDCPYCANQFTSGAMQALQAELTGKGVVWLLVNSVHARHPSYRTPEAARAEWDKLKIKATAWLEDSSGAIGKAYGMKTTPHLFVIARDGTLAYQGAIDDRAATSGDPRTARNYVREAAQKLLAGQKPEVTQTKPYGCGVKYAN
jgi:peroxiredoxin